MAKRKASLQQDGRNKRDKKAAIVPVQVVVPVAASAVAAIAAHSIEDEINSFQAMLPYMGAKKGSFFTGVFLPQKSVLLPPVKTQYKPFQKHVSSY
jgi:hypothetical protein